MLPWESIEGLTSRMGSIIVSCFSILTRVACYLTFLSNASKIWGHKNNKREYERRFT